tara:strand:+ start:1501 stop:1653 length:153 start_codon:yes stop_codon:yes gene_type:complete
MSYTHPTTKYVTANNADGEIPALLFNHYAELLKKYYLAMHQKSLRRKSPV